MQKTNSDKNDIANIVLRDTGAVPNHIELIVNGITKVFKISGPNGEFYLKLRRFDETARGRSVLEHRLLTHLVSFAAPIAGPATAISGVRDDIWWEGERFVGLATNPAPGIDCPSEPKAAMEFGRALSAIHSVPPPAFFPVDPDQFTLPSVLGPYRHQSGNSLDELIDICLNTLAETGVARKTSILGLCHGDARPGNGKYTPAGVTLFDFEFASVADQQYDVATFLWWLASSHPKAASQAELFWAFQQGYGNDRLYKMSPSTVTYFVMMNELRALMFLRNHAILTDETIAIVRLESSQRLKFWREHGNAQLFTRF